MSNIVHHPWKIGAGGRKVASHPGGAHVATLVCGCGVREEIRFKSLASGDVMDRKFRQRGWRLDPSKCAGCQARPKRGMTMAAQAAPTPAAIKAQAKMFNLLGAHFNAEAGTYGGGYSDAKIAEEVGFSPDLIAAFRDEAFGPLKEPPEIAALARDIEALTQMLDEAVTPIKSELSQLRTRLAEVRRKFPA
ncbi:MAG: hypothetical protein ACJ8DZ_13835 [Allosphingosinicella sp.]